MLEQDEPVLICRLSLSSQLQHVALGFETMTNTSQFPVFQLFDHRFGLYHIVQCRAASARHEQRLPPSTVTTSLLTCHTIVWL